MKKKMIPVLAAMLAVGMMSGCAAKDKPLKDMDVDKYVTLGEYKGLAVNVAPVSVDEAELQSLIGSTYSSYVTAETGGITDRAVALGDTVNIDYEGRKDDVPFDSGTLSLTIGSHSFIDGFEDGLIGVMPGETVDLDLSFPEIYPNNTDLAGQPAVFTVTVNFIVPEEMRDDVVASMGMEGVSTVEEFRQSAYDYLHSVAESDYQTALQNEVLNAFMANCRFGGLPKSMMKSYREMIRSNLEQQAKGYGMEAADFTKTFFGKELDEMVEEYSAEGVRQDLAMQAVANREGLNIEDEELNATLQEYADNGGYASVEEFLGVNTAEDYRTYLVSEKVLAFLMDNAAVSNE